jgi:hypothetical protein
MRTAEVELKAIAARILRPLYDLVPRLAPRFDHQRDDHRVVRIFLFARGNFLKIYLERSIGYQFDIVQPDHPQPAVIDRREPRRDVHDRLAKSFPNGTAPPRIERTLDHRAHVRRRC